MQDNFRETSDTKEKLQETLTAAQTDLQEKQGLIVEKDAQIATFNIKVRELFFLFIVIFHFIVEDIVDFSQSFGISLTKKNIQGCRFRNEVER